MWALEFSAEAERDFELIFDHLFTSYVDFGDDPEAAIARAADSIRAIKTSIGKLPMSPYMGTLRQDICAGLRFVRQDKAVVWFLPVEERQSVVVVAVFFGAQDHIRHMLVRMLEEPGGA